jgi:hypothetical protein
MTPADFARIAQQAYDAAPDIGVADSASRAIVRHTTAGLVVAFRGSDNEASWAADVDIETIDVPGVGDVHRGFWRAWEAISVDVLAAIDGNPVTLVGHSLGGSIAIMAAAQMTVGGNPPAAVWSFEPARITPDLSVRTLLSKVPLHLYKTGNDIVPDLPPDWQHAAPLIHIGKPALPFPNTLDHMMTRVLEALSQIEQNS